MSFKELQLEEIQHEHPLILIDLQFLFQDYDEYYDDDVDENDLITMQNFTCKCDRCGLKIDWFHRYYYKCSSKSCNYSLHKFCEEISTTLRSPAHPHILTLKKGTTNWRCCDCLDDHQQDGICYHCSTCSYQIDMRCAMFQEQKMVHHPGHPHPLISVAPEPLAIMRCFGCGDKHKGDFYHCITCFNFSINYDCLSLPIKIFHEYHPFHMLTLSYAFLDLLYHLECRICKREVNIRYWLYKCRKCKFYVHLRCVMAQRNIQLGKKNYIFPKPEESYNILAHWKPTYDQVGTYDDETRDENGYLKHFSHKHPLVLIISNNNNNNDTAAAAATMTSTQPAGGVKLLTCDDMQLHNPMKRIKVLCNGCVRPITSTPFYKCSTTTSTSSHQPHHDHEYSSSSSSSCCNEFVLHEWCARLPTKVTNPWVHHRGHTLVLRSTTSSSVTLFRCKACGLPCNGFAYNYQSCGDDYWCDVNCAFMPSNDVTHEAFPNEEFKIPGYGDFSWLDVKPHPCAACRFIINREAGNYYETYYRRDIYLHISCATRLPKTIRHKSDKLHSLNLTYFPIENHKADYFCEVCEEELNPQNWFYHCSECAQSIHSNCAPLILQSEQGVNSSHDELVYKFINVKFGGVSHIEDHDHPVSFVAGTNNDGVCTKCGLDLHSKIIFKCLQCKFAIHNYCQSSISESKRNQLVHMLDNLDRKHESKAKPDQSQSAIAFYPRRLTRPTIKLVDA